MGLQQLRAEQVGHPEHKSQLTVPQADHLKQIFFIFLGKRSWISTDIHFHPSQREYR